MMLHPLLIASTVTIYYWVGIIVGVVAIITGIWAAQRRIMRSIKKNAISDAALKSIIDANVLVRMSDQDKILSDIKRATRPNGLNTDEVGDIVKRVEIAIASLSLKIDANATILNQHIGQSDEAIRQIRDDIKAIKKNGEQPPNL